jgi:hypothetical protein
MTFEYKHFLFPFFFLFIGINTIVYGQENAVLVKSTMYPFKGWNGSHGGHHIITAGLNTVDKRENRTNLNVIEYNFFYVNDDPTSINCRGFTYGNDIDNCNVGDSYEFPINIPYKKTDFDEAYFEGCIGESDIYGIHLAITGDNQRCISQQISLNYGWNWQYSYDDITWTSFPAQYQENRTISFKINELNGYTGKNKIHFRTGYGTQFTKSIQYDIIGCSPELAINPPVTTPTKCKGVASGSVTLEFKTPLKDGDKFLFNIWDAGGVPTSRFVIKDSIKDNKYIWKGLAEGNYTMKYQAQSINNNGTEVGLSAVTVKAFTIGSPDPLVSIFELPINPTCHNGNGSITINVTGGTGNYFYKIKTDDFNQFDTATTIDAITKIHSATQTIPLPSNITTIYNILITDEKGCVEKN